MKIKLINDPKVVDSAVVIEKTWITAEGYHGACTLNNLGIRCGYVGITETHPLFRKRYTSLPTFTVHGGVTFTGHTSYLEEDLWYVGFDCGHFEDRPDDESYQKYWGDAFRSHAYSKEGRIWSMKDVIEQVNGLSEQLTPEALMQKKMEESD